VIAGRLDAEQCGELVLAKREAATDLVERSGADAVSGCGHGHTSIVTFSEPLRNLFATRFGWPARLLLWE